MCMNKHFSSVKNYNCFSWSLPNRCYFFTFFRPAQNVDVEQQEKTQKNHFFCVLCLFGFSFLLRTCLKLHITSCSSEKCERIVPVLQTILAITANLPLCKMYLGNISNFQPSFSCFNFQIL